MRVNSGEEAGHRQVQRYRVITYYAGDDFPAFLLTVFGKNEKSSLDKTERNALATLTGTLTASLTQRRSTGDRR